MSQVNELLNTMADEDIAAYTADRKNEPHIVIGKDRFIKVPEELRRIAVEGDHNVETVTFDCPRYWDEHDLTEMILYIRYACPDGKPGGYKAQNVRVDDTASDMIHFEWTISENVTGKAGTLAIMVVAKKSDEESGESINRWHSEPNTEMYISKGIPGEDIDYATGNPDLLTQALLLTDRILTFGGGGSAPFTIEASLANNTVNATVAQVESAYNSGQEIVLKCSIDFWGDDGVKTGTNTVLFKLYQHFKLRTVVRYFFYAPLSETENVIVLLTSQEDGSFLLSCGEDQ